LGEQIGRDENEKRRFRRRKLLNSLQKYVKEYYGSKGEKR